MGGFRCNLLNSEVTKFLVQLYAVVTIVGYKLWNLVEIYFADLRQSESSFLLTVSKNILRRRGRKSYLEVVSKL